MVTFRKRVFIFKANRPDNSGKRQNTAQFSSAAESQDTAGLEMAGSKGSEVGPHPGGLESRFVLFRGIMFHPISCGIYRFGFKMSSRDFTGGPVVKNPPSNAGDQFPCRGTKIPHAPGQLSPCTTTKPRRSQTN